APASSASASRPRRCLPCRCSPACHSPAGSCSARTPSFISPSPWSSGSGGFSIAPVLASSCVPSAITPWRRLRWDCRRLPAACVYPVLRSRDDGRPRLDRARPRRLRFMAAWTCRRWRLSVRSGQHPAAVRARRRAGDSVAVDVMAPLSGDHRRACRDLAGTQQWRLGGACLARAGVRAGSINPPTRMGRGDGGVIVIRKNASKSGAETMRRLLMSMAAAALVVACGAGAFAADKLKVGFIYLGPRGDFGWTYQHEVGRQELAKAYGDKIETTFLENVNEGPDAERSIEQLARTGHKLIFTTSF